MNAAERAAIRHNVYDYNSEDELYPWYCHPDYESDILMIPMTKRQLVFMGEHTVDAQTWGPGSRPILLASRWIGPRWCLGQAIAAIRHDLSGYRQDDGEWWEPDARERRTMLTLIRKLERVLSTTTEEG
jgi:hypothetical protein